MVRESPRVYAAVGSAAPASQGGTTTTGHAPRAAASWALELEDVRRHLAGEITLGIYAINPETQRVKWMGIDADYKRSLDDLLKLQYELQQDGIQAASEQSRRGGHLWILFETPVLATRTRVYIRHLGWKAVGAGRRRSGPSDGIELFPKQDRIEANAIRQRDPRTARRSPGSQPALLVLRGNSTTSKRR